MRYLTALVFVTGTATLGVELTAARLLEPWFGNSQLVWSALIGLILAYLALGAWLGGRWADRTPDLSRLLQLLLVAALGVALIPAVSRPVLQAAALGFGDFAPGLLAGALFSVLALFGLPVILLGAVSPWAVRAALHRVNEGGRVAGRLYAAGTAGSILGTFLPVLWLIPRWGSQNTFYLFAVLLATTAGVGTLLQRRHRLLAAITLLLIMGIWLLRSPASIRVPSDAADGGIGGTILYEDESLYNYISVVQWGSERHLKLNEGIGIHSVYHPQSLLSRGIWDYFLLTPFFRPAVPPPEQTRVLLIGLAAGTVSHLWTEIYGPAPITGIELDPQILAVGRQYFAMDRPNLTTVAADGRRWLTRQPTQHRWDVVAVDAYRPPYIPFHLTTVEFFQEVRRHLDPAGVVAVNVGRTDRNFALVDAMAVTLQQVFPAVYVIDEPGPPGQLGNSLVVATMQDVPDGSWRVRLSELAPRLPDEFHGFAQEALMRVRPAATGTDTPLFTDDRAPVEQVVHAIVWSFLFDR